MTGTLDDVTARKKKPEPTAEQKAARELVVGCSGRFRRGGPMILRGVDRLPSERTLVMRDR